MDILAIVGAIIAFAAILMGNSLEGGHFSALVDGPAFLIVVGGTLGRDCAPDPLGQAIEGRIAFVVGG